MQPVYLVSVKNLARFLEALRHAQAPAEKGTDLFFRTFQGVATK